MTPKKLPELSDVKLSVRVDRELLRRLKTHCAAHNLRMQEAVAEAVRQWLKKA